MCNARHAEPRPAAAWQSHLACVAMLAALLCGRSAAAQHKPVHLPGKQARELTALAKDWWQARPATYFVAWDPERRDALATRARAMGAIPEGALPAVVELLWTAARKQAGKSPVKGGKFTIDTPYGPAWAYVDVPKRAKQPPLLIGLHGGGEGAGSADEARGTWVRPGSVTMHPQGIRLVHDTWNTTHGERFVLSLIEMAKLHLDVDPDRVVIAGFSMGGTGSWFFAGRHSDLFAGAAPFSGVLMAAPKSQLESKDEVTAVQHGLMPNVRNLAMAYTIGLADKNTMPGTYLYVADRLAELAQSDPGGYRKIRFEAFPGLAHGFPPGEPGKALDYLCGERRETWPERVVWEYVTSPYPEPAADDAMGRLAKTHFYWLGCSDADDRQRIVAVRNGNEITIDTNGRQRGAHGITVFLNADMIDPAHEVVVRCGDEELYRGKPEPDVWTVLQTLDARLDRSLVFDRRIEL